MEKLVGAFEARRQFGKLLNDVTANGDRFVVERHGEPIAAVVPIGVYRQWQQQREAFFDRAREIAEHSGLTEDEADRLIDEAVQHVRGRS